VRRKAAGQVLALFALALLVILAFVGLAVDGARLFQAHLVAQVLADEAANAAAQQIDIGPGAAMRRGKPPELITGDRRDSAHAAAEEYLLARVTDLRTRWQIEIDSREARVVVEREVELAFLQALGLQAQRIQAAGSATPVSGIFGADN
jgi:hypothetical protein